MEKRNFLYRVEVPEFNLQKFEQYHKLPILTIVRKIISEQSVRTY